MDISSYLQGDTLILVFIFIVCAILVVMFLGMMGQIRKLTQSGSMDTGGGSAELAGMKILLEELIRSQVEVRNQLQQLASAPVRPAAGAPEDPFADIKSPEAPAPMEEEADPLALLAKQKVDATVVMDSDAGFGESLDDMDALDEMDMSMDDAASAIAELGDSVDMYDDDEGALVMEDGMMEAEAGVTLDDAGRDFLEEAEDTLDLLSSDAGEESFRDEGEDEDSGLSFLEEMGAEEESGEDLEPSGQDEDGTLGFLTDDDMDMQATVEFSPEEDFGSESATEELYHDDEDQSMVLDLDEGLDISGDTGDSGDFGMAEPPPAPEPPSEDEVSILDEAGDALQLLEEDLLSSSDDSEPDEDGGVPDQLDFTAGDDEGLLLGDEDPLGMLGDDEPDGLGLIADDLDGDATQDLGLIMGADDTDATDSGYSEPDFGASESDEDDLLMQRTQEMDMSVFDAQSTDVEDDLATGMPGAEPEPEPEAEISFLDSLDDDELITETLYIDGAKEGEELTLPEELADSGGMESLVMESVPESKEPLSDTMKMDAPGEDLIFAEEIDFTDDDAGDLELLENGNMDSGGGDDELELGLTLDGEGDGLLLLDEEPLDGPAEDSDTLKETTKQAKGSAKESSTEDNIVDFIIE